MVRTGLRQGKDAFKSSLKTARQIRENAEQKIWVKRLQLNDLLGKIERRPTQAGLSSRSQTVQDLKYQEAILAGIDADNETFIAASAAFNVEQEGLAQLAQAYENRIQSEYQSIMAFTQLGANLAGQASRLYNLKGIGTDANPVPTPDGQGGNLQIKDASMDLASNINRTVFGPGTAMFSPNSSPSFLNVSFNS